MIRTPTTGLSSLRYGAFSQAALRREGVYRVNVVVGLLGLVLGLYVLHLVWTELYRANAAIAPAGITFLRCLRIWSSASWRCWSCKWTLRR